MKKLILAIAVLTLTGTTSLAQETDSSVKPGKEMKNKTPEERAKAGANHAEKKLGLTADQKTKWEAACLERIKGNDPHRVKLKGSTTPDERKQIHADVRANNKKFDEAVNSLLTDEQKVKHEAIKKEKMEKRKAKMKNRKGKMNEEPLDLDLED
ncbi:MAG: hypothetical protein IPM51_07640 [Sphingobacteriaceae bacterium]|nr:hypothetical protein [Sphingobacteriaceae bacterium]